MKALILFVLTATAWLLFADTLPQPAEDDPWLAKQRSEGRLR